MIDSIALSFPTCLQLLLQHIRLDPHFAAFHAWARAHGVPVVVLSSGLAPVVRALLAKTLGAEAAASVAVVCNDVVDRPPKTREQPGGWDVRFRDESDFGYDKSRTIRPYRRHFEEGRGEKRPVLLYAGDGVSDLSAARETDLLFAKRGRGALLGE